MSGACTPLRRLPLEPAERRAERQAAETPRREGAARRRDSRQTLQRAQPDAREVRAGEREVDRGEREHRSPRDQPQPRRHAREVRRRADRDQALQVVEQRRVRVAEDPAQAVTAVEDLVASVGAALSPRRSRRADRTAGASRDPRDSRGLRAGYAARARLAGRCCSTPLLPWPRSSSRNRSAPKYSMLLFTNSPGCHRAAILRVAVHEQERHAEQRLRERLGLGPVAREHERPAVLRAHARLFLRVQVGEVDFVDARRRRTHRKRHGGLGHAPPFADLDGVERILGAREVLRERNASARRHASSAASAR